MMGTTTDRRTSLTHGPPTPTLSNINRVPVTHTREESSDEDGDDEQTGSEADTRGGSITSVD